jgi:molybdate transport system regulatory protein
MWEAQAMNISARNALQGTVKGIVPGQVNAEVTIDVNGTQIVAVITKASVERLKLAVGMPVTAVIKASNVMIATR